MTDKPIGKNTIPIICAKCFEPYQAGHICGFKRYDWEAARKANHLCACDTCYANWHRESSAAA